MIRVRISALVLAACACFVAASCQQTAAPCSAGDAVMFAHGLECKARVDACADGECKALVREECNRWGDERCGFTSDGAAGAP